MKGATPNGMHQQDLGGEGPADRALDGLFDSARTDGFSGAQSALLWGRVSSAIPIHPGGAGGGGGGAATAAATGSLKAAATWVLGGSLMMASAGLTTVGVAGHALRVPDATASNPPAVIAVASEPPSGAGESVHVADRSAPQAPVVPVVALPHAARSVPVPKVEPSPRAETSPRVTTGARAAFEGEGPSTRVGAATRSEPTPEPKPVTEPRPAVDSRPAPAAAGGEQVSAPAAPVGDPAVTEGALLLRARRVLASNPEEALTLTQQHARLFPLGALIPEREVLAIEALAALGRDAEARSALALFRQHYPRSPHLARLEALVSRR